MPACGSGTVDTARCWRAAVMEHYPQSCDYHPFGSLCEYDGARLAVVGGKAHLFQARDGLARVYEYNDISRQSGHSLPPTCRRRPPTGWRLVNTFEAVGRLVSAVNLSALPRTVALFWHCYPTARITTFNIVTSEHDTLIPWSTRWGNETDSFLLESGGLLYQCGRRQSTAYDYREYSVPVIRNDKYVLPRIDKCGAVVDGCLYVCGGRSHMGYSTTSASWQPELNWSPDACSHVERLDPRQKDASWRYFTSLLKPMSSAAACAL
jgi:hypothetical protein